MPVRRGPDDLSALAEGARALWRDALSRPDTMPEPSAGTEARPRPRGDDFAHAQLLGQWAEGRTEQALNKIPGLIAARYGLTERAARSSGDEYGSEAYRAALLSEGKRPDFLVFARGELAPAELLMLPRLSEYPLASEVEPLVDLAIFAVENKASWYSSERHRQHSDSRPAPARKGPARTPTYDGLSINVKKEEVASTRRWLAAHPNVPLVCIQVLLDHAFAIDWRLVELAIASLGVKKSARHEKRLWCAAQTPKTGKPTYQVRQWVGVACASVADGTFEEPKLGSASSFLRGQFEAYRTVDGGRFRFSESAARFFLSYRGERGARPERGSP